MFTKEKLEKWINDLSKTLYGMWDCSSGDRPRYERLLDLKHTLEQLHTSITSDNSI